MFISGNKYTDTGKVFGTRVIADNPYIYIFQQVNY